MLAERPHQVSLMRPCMEKRNFSGLAEVYTADTVLPLDVL